MEEEPELQESSASSTLDGNSYTVTSSSASVTATGLSISPEQYVTVELEGDGEIELMLPKIMIDEITMVMAADDEIEFETVSASSSSTTIRFEVPQGEDSVNIHGAMVVPEFEVVAMLVLAVSIVGIIAYARFAKTNIFTGLRTGQA